MKFNAGSKISSGGQPSRKRIIFDSDSEEDDLSGLRSPPDSGEEPEEPEGDDIPARLEWLKKFKIPKSNKVFWTAEQLCNLKKNMPGLENFDDSILSAATLKELAIMSRQQLGGWGRGGCSQSLLKNHVSKFRKDLKIPNQNRGWRGPLYRYCARVEIPPRLCGGLSELVATGSG